MLRGLCCVSGDRCVIQLFVCLSYSSNRQLLLCGMSSGSIRVYPLQPGDLGLISMQAYWALSVHDNQYGRLRHVRFSHDELFVLTAGDDGNIFSFSLLPPEELQKLPKKAELPTARVRPRSSSVASNKNYQTFYNNKQNKASTRQFKVSEMLISV